MEADAKIKKYEETVKHLYKLLRKVCQERDEARDQLELLIRNVQAPTPVETTSIIIPQVDKSCLQNKTKPSMNSTKVSYSSSKILSDHSCDLSLSNEKHFSTSLMSQTRIVETSNLTLSNNIETDMVESDKLVCGKPLPQKGRLLQSVTEAGPLLHTLLVDPVPHWKNPPTFSSLALPLATYKDHDNPNGFIPTSLSLAFPGSSHGPSQTSSASNFGLSVKNEMV